MKKLVQFIVCFAFVSFLNAQNEADIPVSFNARNISGAVSEIVLPAFDNTKLLNEDNANAGKGTPLRIGVNHHVNFDMTNSGTLDIMENGDRIWRASFQSEGAAGVFVCLSNVRIPEGATFYFYSPDRSYVAGKYSAADVDAENVIVSNDVPGEEITMEYYEPFSSAFRGSFSIDRIGHNYRSIYGEDGRKGYWGSAEGSCHPDVVCPDVADWQDQVKSVVCIVTTASDAVYLCSGAVINNVRMDKKLYVYSAEHCYKAGASLKFVFNYQTYDCGGTRGSYNQTVQGGVLRAKGSTNNSSDFLLYEITGTPASSFINNIFFSGWDLSASVPSVGACIHHPGGDFKKWSLPSSVRNTNARYWNVSWISGSSNKGVTEHGSSGSPLYNANKLIVGSLSNGASACDAQTGTDNYGKISYSWNNGGVSSSASKLQPWLDPDNTGITTLQGIYYSGASSVNEKSSSAKPFEIYPNPSTGHVTMKGDFISGKAVVNVYSLIGNLVESREISVQPSFSITFNNLPNGIYLVEVKTNTQSYKAKMVIAK